MGRSSFQTGDKKNMGVSDKMNRTKALKELEDGLKNCFEKRLVKERLVKDFTGEILFHQEL